MHPYLEKYVPSFSGRREYINYVCCLFCHLVIDIQASILKSLFLCKPWSSVNLLLQCVLPLNRLLKELFVVGGICLMQGFSLSWSYIFLTWRPHVSFCAASQTVRKIIEINPYMLGTMAGGAADCQFWHRNLGVKVKYHLLLCLHLIFA